MSDSFLAQWARAVRPGSLLTEQDCFILARIAQALDNADQHHRQARHAQAIVAALKQPSEAVMKAAVLHYSGDLSDAIGAAVAAAEQEVGDAER